MQQVQLSDQVYRRAKLRAAEAGFKTVDDYVADLLTGDAENLDHLFTPERLAHIDSVIAKVKAGEETFTSEQAKESDWAARSVNRPVTPAI